RGPRRGVYESASVHRESFGRTILLDAMYHDLFLGYPLGVSRSWNLPGRREVGGWLAKVLGRLRTGFPVQFPSALG
ncbi:MAG TPA: hypothetical protein VF749_14270, partial [Candidatus Acidoferrum sp.]